MYPTILLSDTPGPFNPIIFENLTHELIQKAALRTQDAAGLSGLDAAAWRRLCSSFNSSQSLCSALAAVGRHLCTASVHHIAVSAFVAGRLIPLDKCPGIRPIGVGELPRRIIAKAILNVVRSDITAATGPLQVCTGVNGGCEAAVHAMKNFQRTEAVLLVDATNALIT